MVSLALKSRSSLLFNGIALSETYICSRYVEEKYKLEIGNAQVTQLSKAIAVGAEKGIFSLPKGCEIVAVS
jgi:hypothetical protein